MVPYNKAIFYRIGKLYEEKTGRWRWGYEKPAKTLKSLYKEASLRLRKECSIGFEEQLNFIVGIPYVKYLVPVLSRLKKLFIFLGVGGYLLVSTGEKV